MLKKGYTIFKVFFIFLCLQSCSLQQIKDESPVVNVIQNGDKFKINLPEDHSSGHLWQLGENYDHLKIKNWGAVWHGVEKGIDFNLEALSTGQTTLSLVLRKYNDSVNYKNFIVNIINK
ncbi:MAG: hypothetical protein ABIP51_08890 [Bacteroidia bacterium]